MSYTLDGIETAMHAETRVRDWLPRGTLRYVRCHCNFQSPEWEAGRWEPTSLPALRFHYTHCLQARTPNLNRECMVCGKESADLAGGVCAECDAIEPLTSSNEGP